MNHGEWRRHLQEWRSPGEFCDMLRAARAEHGRDLLTAPGAGWFRDAHAACRFALLRAAARVRLTAAPRPDFELDVAEGARDFEVTEADTPGRRRGDEVKGRRGLDETWATADLAERALRKSAARKTDGRYEPGWGLLIFLNPVDPWDSGETRRAVEARMMAATAAAKGRFVEVWVLWRNAAHNTWLGGVPGDRVLRGPGRTED